MSALDDERPWAERDARIAGALEVDPALGEELEMILAELGEAKRECFRLAFPEELGRHARPAAAVLAALERAAGSR